MLQEAANVLGFDGAERTAFPAYWLPVDWNPAWPGERRAAIFTSIQEWLTIICY